MTARIWVMAVDHGDGLEAHLRWRTTEADARHYYDVNSRGELGLYHRALIDPTGRIVQEDNR